MAKIFSKDSECLKRSSKKTNRDHLHSQWQNVSALPKTYEPIWMNDESLNSADAGTLRARFGAMRERNEIPHQIETDCILIADGKTLRQFPAKTLNFLRVKPVMSLDYWQDEFVLRDIDPDFDEGTEALQDFQEELMVPPPKVFDWLYYTGFTNSKDWRRDTMLPNRDPRVVNKSDRHIFLLCTIFRSCPRISVKHAAR